MNKACRLVVSQLANVWLTVSQSVKSREKSALCPSILAAAGIILSSTAYAAPPIATQLPTGGVVSAGQATITQAPAVMTIIQSSARAAVTWDTFNVGSSAKVNIVQPTSSSVLLNNVLDSNPSQIFGHINANGKVYLSNPNGVYFSPSASVSVGGLVATTNTISTADFMAGLNTFTGNGSAGSVVNDGNLKVAFGGYIALLAPTVRNNGVIIAQMGTVALAAGDSYLLQFNGDSLTNVVVTQATIQTLVNNGNAVYAPGGLIILSAQSAHTLQGGVIGNTGVISATNATSNGGVIRFSATQAINNTGSVLADAGANGNGGNIALIADLTNSTSLMNVDRTISAKGGELSGNGGFIETSGSRVKVSNSAKINTLAAKGKTGSWLIDPTDFTIAANGGDMTGADLTTALLTTNSIIESSAATISGTSALGNINVNDAVSWSANKLTLTAANNVNINAPMNVSGTGTLVMNTATANTTGANVSAAVPGGTINTGFNTNGTFSGQVNFTQSGAGWLTINTKPYTVINNFGNIGSVNIGDFQAMGATGYYALGNSLIATGIPTNGITAFTGMFNGLGHTITGVNITSAAAAGLFGTVGVSSYTQNVGLVGGSVIGGVNSGGLIGWNYGTVSNSYNTGTVSSASGGQGGLIGRNENGNVTNSYATGAVSGAVNVGGLIGENMAGQIINDYATGSVTSLAAGIGGLVGYSTTGAIINSYATGAVKGATGVGGLLGGGTSGNVTNSHATGNVLGTTNTGGLVGSLTSGVVSKSYATGTVGGTTSTGGLVGLTTGLITTSYATGNVTGATNTGGLVANTTGNVLDSYASGNVVGSDGSSGGLIGITTGPVATSYASGSSVTGLTKGLIGTTSVPAQVTSSYFNGTLNNGRGSGTSLTTAQMQSISSFAGFSISNSGVGSTWLIYDGVTTPLLSAFLTPVTLTSIYSGAQPAAFNNIIGYTSDIAIDASKLITTSAGLTLSSTNVAGSETAILSGFGTTQQGYSITYAPTTITGTGSIANDLNISAPISWSSGILTLNAQNNINFNSALSGSSTAQLALNYGLSAGALNNPSDYVVNKAIDLPGGQNFKTTFGSDGITKNYMVITRLGDAGDASAPPTLTTLQGMAATSNLAKNFVLGNNIDASATANFTYNGFAGFIPVGTTGFPFTGYFDGLGHTVTNLNFETGATANAGLFGATSGPTRIQNVGLVGGNMNGGAATGGLVGYNASGLIRNSYNTGNVSGDAFTGGLVGQNIAGNINNSYTTGTIVGAAYTGGLVGGATTGNVSNSHATGSVHGAAGTGGLVGTITTGTVTNSYATGSVLGGAGTGGLVGTSTGLITTSYATGVVAGTIVGVPGAAGAAGVGGLVGTTAGQVSVSFASGSVSGGAGVGGLIGTSTRLTLNTYATGMVTAATSAGGLIGATTGPVQNSYASGAVTGAGATTGALLGTSTVTNSHNFFDSQSNLSSVLGVGAASIPGNVTGMTTANMMVQGNFTSSTIANGSINPTWDFADTWIILPGTMPFLRTFMTPVTVTANSANTIYSGSAYVGGATYSLTPTPVLGGTLSYSYLNNSTSAITNSVSNVGSYAVTPSGLLSTQQYLVTYVNGSVTINPAPLGISNTSATYAGSTNIGSTNGLYALTGLVVSDLGATVSSATANNNNATSNSGATYFTAVTLSGANVGNYTLNSNANTGAGNTQNSLVLAKATIAIMGATTNDTYTSAEQTNSGAKVSINGGTATSISGMTVSTGIGSESFTLSGYGTGTNAATYNDNLSLSAASGTTAGNYSISSTQGSLVIGKADVTITETASLTGNVYKGSAYTGAYTTNFLGSDASQVTVSGMATGTNAATYTSTLSAANTGSSTALSNYNTPTYQNANLVVSRAIIAIAGATNNVTYTSAEQTNSGAKVSINGGTATSISGMTVSTGIGSESFTLSGYGTGTNAATYNDNLSLSAASGTTAGNYSISSTQGSLVIGKADVTITETASLTGNVYKGSAYTGAYTTNFLGSDASQVTVSGMATGTNAATYTSTLSAANTGSSTALSNYNTPTYQNANLVISPALLTVTVNDATKVTGTINPDFTSTVSGLVNNDILSNVTSGFLVYSTLANIASPVGSFNIVAGHITATSNYMLVNVDGTLTITAAAVETPSQVDPLVGNDFANNVVSPLNNIELRHNLTEVTSRQCTEGPNGAVIGGACLERKDDTLDQIYTLDLSNKLSKNN